MNKLQDRWLLLNMVKGVVGLIALGYLYLSAPANGAEAITEKYPVFTNMEKIPEMNVEHLKKLFAVLEESYRQCQDVNEALVHALIKAKEPVEGP